MKKLILLLFFGIYLQSNLSAQSINVDMGSCFTGQSFTINASQVNGRNAYSWSNGFVTWTISWNNTVWEITAFGFQYATMAGNSSPNPLNATAAAANGTPWVTDPGNCPGAVVDFSGAGTQSTLLPVELSFFEGKREDSKNVVQLKWQTLSEINNDYFSIQKSTNGKDFQEIGTQEGAGTTLEAQNYSFMDERPDYGINYYRLMQMDYDGEFSYSDVVPVDFRNNGTINIYPNPAKETLQIANQEAWKDAVELVIYALDGQLIKTVQYESPETNIALDIQDLNIGLYQVQIISGNQVSTQRFVKD